MSLNAWLSDYKYLSLLRCLQQTPHSRCLLDKKAMEYREKYIALLEEENAWLKQRNAELEVLVKDTKKDLLTAITKWDEAMNKLAERAAYKG